MHAETSNVDISGMVILINNSVDHSGFKGGGVDMIVVYLTITGNVSFTDNHAGYAGGGMSISRSS